MALGSLKDKDLKPGDLVTHILYGKEWIGVIVSINEIEESINSNTRRQVLVQIQPGTKFDGFFDKMVSSKNRVTGNLGYVSINWLFKLELKNEKT
tara:strand:+ start:1596 stop:1880 length:285 start_codon:yes stop_codon:yes gene_type:complete